MNIVISNQLKNFAKMCHIESYNESKQFEYFINYIMLKQYITFDVNNLGLISTGNNAPGIDGIGIIIDGQLVFGPDDVKTLFKESIKRKIEIIFIQSKTSEHFDLSCFSVFCECVDCVIEGRKSDNDTEELESYIDAIKEIYNNSSLFANRPNIKLLYVTTGDYKNDENFERIKTNNIEKLKFKKLFSNIEIRLLGADDIDKAYENIGKENSCEISTIAKLSQSDFETCGNFVVALLNFSEFKKVICDDTNSLKEIFEDNIRGYLQNETQPNKSMMETINTGKGKSFCLLNNGITIVANKVRETGNKIYLENYQIVNGCQTSNVLYENIDNEHINDIRVLVKMIETSDDDFVKEIVCSTNNQNSVDIENLEALRKCNKELEKYFEALSEKYSHKVYYERRINQYKNDISKEMQKISIEMLAKSYYSVVLEKPEIVASNYGQIREHFGIDIYTEDLNKDLYYISGYLFMRVIERLDAKKIDVKLKKYRFHLMLLIKRLLKKNNDIDIFCNNLNDIMNVLDNDKLFDQLFDKSVSIVDKFHNENKDIARKLTEKRSTTDTLIRIVENA